MTKMKILMNPLNDIRRDKSQFLLKLFIISNALLVVRPGSSEDWSRTPIAEEMYLKLSL